MNGCRQRLLFARQLTQRKCSLCSQGTEIRELKPKTTATATATATKTSLKERIRAASNFTALFQPHSIRLFELNSKGLYQSSGKETEGRFPVSTSSTKREIRQFHVVVVQRRQRNVQKSVLHVQNCLLIKPIGFLRLSLPSPSSLCIILRASSRFLSSR